MTTPDFLGQRPSHRKSPNNRWECIKNMIKLTSKLLLIFLSYCILSTLLYSGRVHENPLCKTDFIVFLLPFLISIFIYQMVISKHQHLTKKKIGSPLFWGVLLAIFSEIVSMYIKFNLYGT